MRRDTKDFLGAVVILALSFGVVGFIILVACLKGWKP